MATQFQAVLECTQDPCRGPICNGPARRWPVEHSGGPFPCEDAAREHGRAQARLVYGSEHRVLVESREVTEWQETR